MRAIVLVAVALLAAGCAQPDESAGNATACGDDASPAYQGACPSGAQQDIENSTMETPTSGP